ncbi:unnamed protein product, partial [Prorocentrum cordatum]
GGGAAQVRTEFQISNGGELPGPADCIQAGAKRVAQFFAAKSWAILPFDPPEARKIMASSQVAQSIRATLRADDDPAMSASEANAAGQPGSQAALAAASDYAGGGGAMDEASRLPLITADHAQRARRMLDINIGIQAIWRAALGDEGRNQADEFAAPLPAQSPAHLAAPPAQVPVEGVAGASTAHPPAQAAGAGFDESQPATLGAEGEEQTDAPPVAVAQGPEKSALKFSDVAGEEDFDKQGLGADGAMIFARPEFKGKELIRRVLLTGKSSIHVNACVDLCAISTSEKAAGAKRKKQARPSKPDVAAVLKPTFEQFPRLGAHQTEEGGVVLKGWPDSMCGRMLFHSDLMC